MRITVAFATLLFTTALSAQQAHVYPFAPTTATPIEVHYLSGCRSTHEVVREGETITITARNPQCDVTGVVVEKVKLPEVLPIGEYSVNVVQEHDPFYITGTSFVVRNGAPVPFEVHPSTLDPYDQPSVYLKGASCERADCSDVIVRVGGEVVPVSRGEYGALWFIAPLHGPGFADVTVEQGTIKTSPGALYFSNTYRHPAHFEPILLPILLDARGAFGSRWTSQAVISNPMPYAIDADYTLSLVTPCITDCNPPFEAKSFQDYGDGYPRGTVMWVPRSEASQVALSLRIRDLSHAGEGWGANIPIVRERDFVHGKNIRLLDVPLDPRYRVKVRIYRIEPFLSDSQSGSVILRRGDALQVLPFTLTHSDSSSAIEPHYAEVDLPQGAVGERVNVEIAMPPDAIGWAFASVTNNATQQVTVVAPY